MYNFVILSLIEDPEGAKTAIFCLSAVIVALFLLISILIANGIKFEGGSNPKDKRKRRIWFWIMGVLCAVTIITIGIVFHFTLKLELVLSDVIIPACISSGVGFLVYVLVGLILSKIFKHGKLGHWF